jgi:DNA replication and repair protein RecF
MIVNSITLKNFRNHDFVSYDFKPGLNILTGPNGVGKTNIVEAIYYLSLARSFRINEEEGLIQEGKDKAEIKAVVSEGSIKRNISINLTKEGKNITINNKSVTKLSDLAKIVNVVLFEPKDVMFFRGSPKVRRNFLDISISKKSALYFDYISRYEKVLKERNDLLKSENPDKLLLEATTEMLVKLSGSIVSYREMYVKDINDILIKITRVLAGVCENIELVYKPFVPNNKDFSKNALQAFKRAEENDIKKKVTTIGIHREDISLNLNGRDISEFGSQGENRLVALALKISPYFLIEDKDKRPIIVLDDVMSELDQSHRQKLITFLKKFEQVFITATRLEVSDANHYQLKKKQKEAF